MLQDISRDPNRWVDRLIFELYQIIHMRSSSFLSPNCLRNFRWRNLIGTIMEGRKELISKMRIFFNDVRKGLILNGGIELFSHCLNGIVVEQIAFFPWSQFKRNTYPLDEVEDIGSDSGSTNQLFNLAPFNWMCPGAHWIGKKISWLNK